MTEAADPCSSAPRSEDLSPTPPPPGAASEVALQTSSAPASALPFLLLGAASALVEGIREGMRARGFPDVRPAHGFALARIAAGGSTVGELAGYLGMTKQAASQLVDELSAKGYVERHADPRDARVRRVRLTDRGRACTGAAEEAVADMVRRWRELLGDARLDALRGDLARVSAGGRLRPSW